MSHTTTTLTLPGPTGAAGLAGDASGGILPADFRISARSGGSDFSPPAGLPAPGAGAAALEVNYRCAERIVSAATSLLGYNRVRVGKRIRPVAGADPDPGAFEIRRHAAGEAATGVTELVSTWRMEDGVDSEQIAILVRVNSLLLGPQIALWNAGVPLRSSVGPELLDRAGVAAALAWIRLAVDPEGLIPADLETVRRRPSRGFPGWISKWFVNCRSVSNLRAAAMHASCWSPRS